MKTLKIGKKEFTVLDGNEMFVLRQSLCGVMADLDFIKEHLTRTRDYVNQPETISTVEDFVLRKITSEIESSHLVAMHAFARCKITLEDLRES